MGFISQPEEDKIRLDIGAGFDLFDVDASLSDYNNLVMAVDMMTFTRLRSEGRFKFPVETTDYYFGINFSQQFTKNAFISTKDEFRLRIAHISSHFIDGLSEDGEFQKTPFTFSKEFAEFLYRANTELNISPYIGVNYIFSRIPDEINPIEIKAGVEYRNRFEGSNFGVNAGYDFTLKGVNKVYSGVNAAQLGIEYYFYENRSISLNLYGYNGLSMHGILYNQKVSYIGLGIQLYYF